VVFYYYALKKVCFTDCSLLLEIFSIYAIDDHKQLYVLKQAVIAPERMVLAAIDLVEGFFDFDVRTFEFYLYQR
jgi:hypothetical protein